jgi:hypothetical protein
MEESIKIDKIMFYQNILLPFKISKNLFFVTKTGSIFHLKNEKNSPTYKFMNKFQIFLL